MGCLEMFNSDHKGLGAGGSGGGAPISPRISFSNDFVESHSQEKIIKQEERGSREAPISTDFEFSVTNYSMICADELFFKGKLLPLKDSCSNNQMKRTVATTLRDELLVQDDDDDDDGDDDDGDEKDDNGVSLKPPRGPSSRWKGFLGLGKSHVGLKKIEKNDGFSMQKAPKSVASAFSSEPPNFSKPTKETVGDEGSSGTDMEKK
ncbi:hypothetical protein Nepgr_026443 [Nepenthes gracilis]|uniref:Uncharacterized protein n=1 Tax=Nepenthes gracilis TaxID=150966 RepID=A0AAD3Y216_NEPGR|nr:hypothetical protein Nepgr_026443 [Nepenthes gracilis]